MKRRESLTLKMTKLVAATLAGGTLFGTCEIRLRDAFVDGGRLFISQILSPGNFIIVDDTPPDTEN